MCTDSDKATPCPQVCETTVCLEQISETMMPGFLKRILETHKAQFKTAKAHE